MVEESLAINSASDEEEPDPTSHNKLLGAVSRLYKKQRVSQPKRSEPSFQISEFNLSGVTKEGSSFDDKVHVDDLAKILKKKSNYKSVQDHVSNFSKKIAPLPKPVEKMHADQIARQVGYDNLKEKLTRWEPIVLNNRVSGHLKFPLRNKTQDDTEDDSTMSLTPFSKKSELELNLLKVLNSSKVVLADKEKKKKYDMKLKEIMEQRRIAAKIRAQESYQLSKNRRQSKIKSKKYHRVLRKEKMKKDLKEFEALQKSDPEAALEKLQAIEKARAEERATLRHKSTGQWARSKQIRAKYDREARAELAEQLSKGRELTNASKTIDASSSDDEDPNQKDMVWKKDSEADNPWTAEAPDQSSDIKQFFSGYRKYWNEKNNDVPAIYPTIESAEGGETNNSNLTTACSSNEENVEDDSANLNVTAKDNTLSKRLPCSGDNVDGEDSPLVLKKPKNLTKKSGLRKLLKSSSKLSKLKLLQQASMKKKSVPKLKKCSTFENLSSVSKVKESSPQKRSSGVSLDKIFDDLEDNLSSAASSKMVKLTKEIKPVKVKKGKPSKDNVRLEGVRTKELRGEVDEAMMETLLHSNDTDEISRYYKVRSLADFNKPSQPQEVKEQEPTPNSSNIDPNKFMEITGKVLSSRNLPDVITEGDDVVDDADTEQEKRMNLIEAFADDDVVDQFRKEKEEEIKSSNPQDIDLTLPGWGSWAGTDIKRRKRTTRRFIVKAPKPIRKDDDKPLAIVNEDPNTSLKPHLVNELPYPFTRVQDFEASIRAPIGSTWVSQKAHKKLTQPPVSTKMGTIIEPITEEHLLEESPALKEKKAGGKKWGLL